jgi:diacylglycerol O-acyltransferase / wax synthase
MSYTHAERLSALDHSFLALEEGRSHMHIGAVAVFEAAPVTLPSGGIDIDRIMRLMEAGIHRIPRYRQRLEWTPGFQHPVWVDDARFNLAYHVRHTHLPHPGDDRLLKRLAGRLMSQELDRGKPLWEMWVVEGLENGRFALITKAHHCMIDGVGSVELTGSVMRPTPDEDPRLAEPPPRWIPRPAPSPRELWLREAWHRAMAPIALARLLRDATAAPRAALETAAGTASGLVDALKSSFRPASSTPFNVEIGPHRRFDWTAMDLDRIRAIKARLGGTVNDVVLALFSGALRRFFHRRGLDVAGLDFRAMLPVNVRAADEHMGNRVAMMAVRLPLDVADPRERLARVVAETTRVKQSHQAAGIQALEELSDRTFTSLFTQFARMATRSQPYNVVVTNVPGPPFPVYVLGARMLACYPVVPLFQNQALGLALFSYDGRIYWGFNSDWDVVPDLHDLVAAVDHEIDVLGTADVLGPLREAAAG